MRELFLQIVYGRTQSAFSEGGLIIGAGLEDLGKGLRLSLIHIYAGGHTPYRGRNHRTWHAPHYCKD